MIPPCCSMMCLLIFERFMEFLNIAFWSVRYWWFPRMSRVCALFGFHMRMVVSSPAEAMYWLLCDQLSVLIEAVCPLHSLSCFPVFGFQMRNVLSWLPVAILVLSGDHAKVVISSVCPLQVCCGLLVFVVG